MLFENFGVLVYAGYELLLVGHLICDGRDGLKIAIWDFLKEKQTRDMVYKNLVTVKPATEV